MYEYELKTIYDSKKSFYGKANIIIEDDGTEKLKSYNTIVCEIIHGKPKVYGTYSNTTLRHIKEFLKQKGFKADTKTQILQDYLPTDEELKNQEKQEKEKAEGLFNSIKMICAFGDIINNTQQEKNNWNERMLKAGLENKGLSFPKDWDTLSEDEKEKRLKGAIGQL